MALIGGQDSTVALDLLPDDSEQASVLSDDSGLALDSGSSLTLAADSGISLEADEGITLDVGGDSGISLEGIGDSGISLEDSDEFGGTVPMMDAMPAVESVDETKFEIPAMQDDSAFDLKMKDKRRDDTGVLDLRRFRPAVARRRGVRRATRTPATRRTTWKFRPTSSAKTTSSKTWTSSTPTKVCSKSRAPARSSPRRLPAGQMAVEQEWGGGVVASLAVSCALMAGRDDHVVRPRPLDVAVE